MYTYQDLIAVGNNEKDRMEFVQSVVRQHLNSIEHRIAADNELYYSGENPTIYRYQKIIYDLMGKAHKDPFSPNHKISSSFFGFAVDQEINYLLGNGVLFGQESTTKNLGKGFHKTLKEIVTRGSVQGRSFGFWNYDHLEAFSFASTQTTPGFAALYDEDTGVLSAGVRFWQIDGEKPLRMTLYEPDGYTEYIKRKDSDCAVFKEKTAYKQTIRQTLADGVISIVGENYSSIPIIEFRYNASAKSKITGKRTTIDAYDFIFSNLINTLDEGNFIYWLIQNADGMNEVDDVKLLERIKTLHVVHGNDSGTKVEPHTIDIPHEATRVGIDSIKKKLYEDFQAFDASAVSAGTQTATAIRACYTNLDLLVDKTEDQVTAFIESVLSLIGIDDTPTYSRNKIVNTSEEVQNVLVAAQYLPDDYITSKIVTALGDIDRLDEILDKVADEAADRFIDAEPMQNEGNIDEIADTEEALETAENMAGKTLNGAQTQSLLTVMRSLSEGSLTEGQAINIISTAIGVTKEEARAIIEGK